jgi:alcohol dehydrogenase
MKVKAAVLNKMGVAPPYAQSKPLSIEGVELDDPGHGEVMVKIGAAGLCHSDLSVIDGNRPRPTPMVLGHEAAGIVEKLGPGVEDLKVGDHVVMVFVPSCGTVCHVRKGAPRSASPGPRPTEQVRSFPANGGFTAMAPTCIITSASLLSPTMRLCRAGPW